MGQEAVDLTATWREHAATRDLGLRNHLVELHLPLARTVAAMLYRHRGALEVEFADYMQFATLGLIEAVDRFDVERGVGFASFASVRIRGAVLNALGSLSEQHQQNDLRKRLRRERLDSLRQPPPPGDDPFTRLADMAVGLALSQVLEGSGMLQSDTGHDSAYQQPFYDAARERQMRESVERLVDTLPDQERRVIRYHYFQNIAFVAIAQLMGLTRGRVSQIHHHALKQMRRARGGSDSVDRDA